MTNNERTQDLLTAINGVCELRGYNLMETIDEKIAYNAQRPDHKKVNRSKSGGKKF